MIYESVKLIQLGCLNDKKEVKKYANPINIRPTGNNEIKILRLQIGCKLRLLFYINKYIGYDNSNFTRRR